MMDETVRISTMKDTHFKYMFINGDIVIPFDRVEFSGVTANLYLADARTPAMLLLSKAEEFKALWEAIQ